VAPPQNSRRRNVDVTEVPFCSRTTFSCHPIQYLVAMASWRPGFVQLWLWGTVTKTCPVMYRYLHQSFSTSHVQSSLATLKTRILLLKPAVRRTLRNEQEQYDTKLRHWIITSRRLEGMQCLYLQERWRQRHWVTSKGRGLPSEPRKTESTNKPAKCQEELFQILT
jgi:hypothetical protein